MDLGVHLIDGWPITRPAHVALVGGGGKTTLMRSLFMAGAARGWRTVAGTTTRVGAHQVTGLEPFLSCGEEGDKLVGCAPERFDDAFGGGAADLLVVEADGSRGKVVKAPADHEPVIPSTVTHVLAVIGADGLDRVIEDAAHRPMLVAALCGCSPYERLTIDRATMLLASDRGAREHVPSTAVFAVAITRIGPRQVALADRLAAALAAIGVDSFRLPLV